MKRSLWLVALIVLLLNLGAVQAQTSITLPKPTGAYPVGRITYHLIDTERDEVFTDDPSDQRELMLTVHYPAEVDPTLTPAPYTDEALGAAIAQMFGIPPIINTLIQSHAYVDVPVNSAEEPYPVILFSPGMGNFVLFYTALLEDIASHGYIVVSISRPYSDPIVTFPDGRFIMENDAGGYAQFANATTQDDLITFSNRIVPVWVADAKFVLDQLEAFQQNDPLLAGKFDLEHIGILGHSMGGIAASSAIASDDRLDAGVSLDGGTAGDVVENGITAPFMFMISEPPQPTDEELAAVGMPRQEFERVRSDFDAQVARVLATSQSGYFLEILGSAHNTYTTDFDFIAPLMPDYFTPAMVGTIDSITAVDIIDTYVVGFFNKHLKGAEVPMMDTCGSNYPEVIFKPAALCDD